MTRHTTADMTGVSLASKGDRARVGRQVLNTAARLVLLAGAAWIGLGFAVNLLLAVQAPVTSEHLHLASWLGSRGLAVHFTGGPAGTLLMVGLLIGGLAVAAARSVGVVCVGIATVGACCSISLSEEAYVRLGVLEGTVKIGCYVESSAECLQQLGVEHSGKPSRYMPEGTSYEPWRWSDWYRNERAKVVSTETERRAQLTTLPGATVLLAPLHALDGARLERLLDKQLQETLRRRSELATAR